MNFLNEEVGKRFENKDRELSTRMQCNVFIVFIYLNYLLFLDKNLLIKNPIAQEIIESFFNIYFLMFQFMWFNTKILNYK